MAVQTGAGNVTTNSSTGTTVAVTLPANLVVGDILVCTAHNKTGPASVTFDKGTWTTVLTNAGTANNRSGGIYYIVITTASLAALGTPGSSTVTLTMGTGTSRRIATFTRLTGRDTTNPLDVVSADYGQASASATATLPAMMPTKTGSDIIGLVFDNESGNVQCSGTGTNGLTQINNPYIYDGSSSSTLMTFYQNNATTSGVSTGTRTVTLSPTPLIVAGGGMAAFAPAPAATAASLPMTMDLSADTAGADAISVSLGMTMGLSAGIRTSQPGEVSLSSVLRTYFLNKLELTETAKYSLNDLMFAYYQSQTGTTGTISDMQRTWLESRGFNNMNSYLASLGYSGDYKTKLLNYYSDLPPLAGGGGDPFESLDFGGADFGAADFGEGPGAPLGVTYYVSNTGSDSNDGLTTSTPWQTIGKVNSVTLAVGDEVRFNGGQTFNDTLLYLTASGTDLNPIYIGSYGTGKATLAPPNANAIYAYNCAGIEIRDLICTAAGSPGGAGIQFYSDAGAGRRESILIEDVTVTGYQNGISIGVSSSTVAGFSGISILNSELSSNRDNGLIIYGPAYNVATPFYAVTDLIVEGVTASSNAGNSGNTSAASGFGLNIGSVSVGTVMRCKANANGASNGGTTVGPVGIMIYNSRDVVVDSCLAYSNRNGAGSVDGEGIDLDINCINCTVQYSFAYDNDGAGVLLFGSSSNSVHTGSVVRYNLCWGNGREVSAGTYWGDIKLAGNISSATIFGNTLVSRDTGSTQPVPINIDSTPTGVRVLNNILYGHTGPSAIATTAWTTSQVLMQGNLYYRSAGTSIKWGATTYTSLATWRAAIAGQEQVSGANVGVTSDPLLNNAGVSPTVTAVASMTGYTDLKLSSGSSPANNAGVDLGALGISSGTRDFWETTLGTPLSIGAHEYV